MSREKDLESGENGVRSGEVSSGEFVSDDGAVHEKEFVIGNTWYAKAQRFAGKFGVEQRGIERVPSNERSDASMSHIGTMVSSLHIEARTVG